MSKRTGPTNPLLKSAIESMRMRGSSGVKIWEDVARKLSKSTRSRVEVNVAEINRNSKDGETIVVPGVVLSAGKMEKKVNVAAWRFSGSADKKIAEAGGRAITIDELRKENPKGTNVKLMV